MMLLEIENLTKSFSSGDTEFVALKEVNLSVEEKEYVCISGRSGSGKSTLLNIITGLMKPTSGSVRLRGMELVSKDDKDLSILRNQEMSYMMQGFSMLNNLTLLENVMLPAEIYNGNTKEIEEKAKHLLERVGLSDKLNNYPRQLSGGEVRRGMIARALINDPKIFITDEPTDGLDEETADSIMELFGEIHRSGVALLVVSHEPQFRTLADRSYIMKSGRLTCAGGME